MSNNGKFIAVLVLLVGLMASIGGVYLRAQSYTDRRVVELRDEVKEDLQDIKDNQKEQGKDLKDVLGKLNQYILERAREDRERRRENPR